MEFNYILFALVCFVLGFLLRKTEKFEKFNEVWDVFGQLLGFTKELIENIEAEIPDDTQDENLKKIDKICKSAIEYLEFGEMFLNEKEKEE